MSRSEPNGYEVETDVGSMISFQQKRMIAEKIFLNARSGIASKKYNEKQNLNTVTND